MDKRSLAERLATSGIDLDTIFPRRGPANSQATKRDPGHEALVAAREYSVAAVRRLATLMNGVATVEIDGRPHHLPVPVATQFAAAKAILEISGVTSHGRAEPPWNEGLAAEERGESATDFIRRKLDEIAERNKAHESRTQSDPRELARPPEQKS